MIKPDLKKGLFFVALCLWCFPAAATSLSVSTLDSIWDFSLSRLRSAMTQLGNNTTQFPRRAPQTGGVWQTVSASDWVSGFYPGCLWYAYEKSRDTAFRAAAQRWTLALDAQKNNTGTHDVGFMIFCSYGNAFRLVQTTSYRQVILTAAQSLSTRYNATVGTIDSWNWMAGHETIIDNMMNLELLFWSARNGGSLRFDSIACSHADKTMQNHIRSDSSTFHVVKFSTTSGAVISRETRQGYSDSSCWARGQAWAVYGFTMAYRFTRDPRYLAAARSTADYYLRRLPADRVPFWDFDAPGIPADTVPRDASSSAIVASALLELATFTGAPDSGRYRDSAVSFIRALWSLRYRGLSSQASILNHSTGSRKEGHDVDMGIIYADYYFLEALLRYEMLLGTTGTSRFTTMPAYPVTRERMLSRISTFYDLRGRALPGARPPAPGLFIAQRSDAKALLPRHLRGAGR
ncbi:MAG: glycoside hydrolase family 88 protein [Chitinispirillaceae bacterium]|nr:glycoside hydrolase family 88 protein [Chitinispirillaceae bacterium]